MTAKCGICKEALSNGISTCFGICGRLFHARCVGMTTSHIKAMNECSSLKFVCSYCQITTHNAILQKVTRLVDDMGCLRQISDDVNDIKQVVNKSEDELKILSDNVVSVKENRDMCVNINKSTDKTMSYAEIVKRNEPVVMVVPKQKQTSTVTKNAVMQSMDPTKIPLNNLRNAANGIVILEGNSRASVDEIKKYATDKLGEAYDVKLSELTLPKIRITGIYEKMSSEEILDKLKSQNTFLNNSQIKVLSVFGKKKFNAIIEIDCNGFNLVMNRNVRTLNIGWAKCSVYEHLNIKRCFKCYGFNHVAKDCSRKKACSICAGEHERNSCKSSEVKCVNCYNANKKFKLNLNEKHTANSFNCKVLMREENIRRKRVCYEVTE